MQTAPSSAAKVRVLIADDSTFMRRMLSQALTEQGFDIVGEASDGDEALALYQELKPDAMTLDLAMPGTDGIAVLKKLSARGGGGSLPVIVVSAFSPAHGARAVDALAEGAFDLVAKPALGEPLEVFIAALRDKVTAAAAAATAPASAASRPAVAPAALIAPRRTRTASGKPVLIIAISTGGPKALGALAAGLPAQLGAGGYIVQHMPAGFTASLAERIDRVCPAHIVEAHGGEQLKPDTLYLAPGGRHLRLVDGGRTAITDEEPIGGLRPRADLTIEDAVKLYGSRVVLVVMTGMGKDGLAGARAVRAAGGRIIAEAESSCTVYGMPRAVAEAGLVDVVAPLEELGAVIANELR